MAAKAQGTFGVGGVLYSWYLITQLPHQHDATLAFLTLALAFVILTGYTSINAVVKAELFPAHIRALGVALPYALANTLFGGTAEFVALWFKQSGMESAFYIYVSVMIAISLTVYVRMRDTKAHSRILED